MIPPATQRVNGTNRGISPHQGDIGVTQDYAGTISVNRAFYGDMGFDANVTADIALAKLVGDVTIARHCVPAHGRRERARQIARAGKERIFDANQVLTRWAGVRRGL